MHFQAQKCMHLSNSPMQQGEHKYVFAAQAH